MPAAETVQRLTRFHGRAAGTDAERRAAQWLAGELRQAGRQPVVQTFWCRPNWALAQAYHCVLALAGSLLSVSHAVLGGVYVLRLAVGQLSTQLSDVERTWAVLQREAAALT